MSRSSLILGALPTVASITTAAIYSLVHRIIPSPHFNARDIFFNPALCFLNTFPIHLIRGTGNEELVHVLQLSNHREVSSLPSMARRTRATIFADLSSPIRTSSFASFLPPEFILQTAKNSPLIFRAFAHHFTDCIPDRSDTSSTESIDDLTGVNDHLTDSHPCSLHRHGKGRQTASRLHYSSAEMHVLTLSPSFFHALLSKMKVLSASFTSVVRLRAAL